MANAMSTMPWLELTTTLTPLIAAYRTQAEATFRMAPEVRQKVGETGLFRLAHPPGPTRPDISLNEFIRVHEELAFADPSVAWASCNSNAAVLLLGRLRADRIADVLAPSTTFIGLGLPPTGRAEQRSGVLHVSGRWPVISGSNDADWFMLNCVLHGDGVAESTGSILSAKFVPVPKAAVTVEDTWQGVIAVRGSGSNAVSVDGYDLPEDRAVALFGAKPPKRDALTVMDATSPFAMLSLQMAALAAGIGRSAMEAAVKQAGRRVSVVNQTNWFEWPAVQNTVASAQIAIDSTRASLFELTAHCQIEIDDSGILTDYTKGLAHALADHAFRTVRHAVSDLFTVGSVDALRSGHGLEQALRDIHGFGVQWERYRRLHYSAGRVFLGAPANDPLF
jgi:alkylation response protein AidB-like acyl-CoA dehydrogenase